MAHLPSKHAVASCSGRKFVRPAVSRAAAPRASSPQEAAAEAVSRRSLLMLPSVLCLSNAVAAPRCAAEAAATPTAETPQASTITALETFLDQDYQLDVPSTFEYIPTEVNVAERGPQPEKSPLLARFNARGGSASISVLCRKGASLKPTLIQLSDISQYGDAVGVAKLLLPRGATLLSAKSLLEKLPPKETPLGVVDIPPRTYYIYDFSTPNGLHVAMSAAANQGKVFVVGAAVAAPEWTANAELMQKVVSSFRLRQGTGSISAFKS